MYHTSYIIYPVSYLIYRVPYIIHHISVIIYHSPCRASQAHAGQKVQEESGANIPATGFCSAQA